MKRTDQDHLNLLCDISDLSDILTGSVNIEQFLQQTIKLVARHLKADVCSIYLYEEKSDALVLEDTIGLNPEAVGKIRLKSGEGLVGKCLAKGQPTIQIPGGKTQ